MTATGEEEVSSIGMALAEGAYTLVVKEEFIIVNGIIASPFAFNHVAGNLFYHIHRFLYSAAPWLLSSALLRSSNEVSLTPIYPHPLLSHTISTLSAPHLNDNAYNPSSTTVGAWAPSSYCRLYRLINNTTRISLLQDRSAPHICTYELFPTHLE